MTIKKIFRRFVPFSKREQKIKHMFRRWNVYIRDFKKTPPILIYQMGKVGSSTVATSLKQLKLRKPIYQIHRLSHDGIQEAEATHRTFRNPELSDDIKLSKTLRQKIDRYGGVQGIDWKIITLIREPIAVMVSALFQNMEKRQADLIDENGQVKLDDAIAVLLHKFENFDENSSYVCQWFNQELKTVFDIDIYQYPFHFNHGYGIIHHDHADVLIIRLEDLNHCGSEALTQFLGCDRPVPLLSENVGVDKKYSAAYQYVKQHLVVPRAACEKIYASKLAQHFYTDQERQTLIQKWSKDVAVLHDA